MMPRPDQLEAELRRLQERTRARRSVDGFARAALEGFLWAVVAGVCGKLAVVDERVMALLFAADRLDHLNTQIEPRLARGEDVILDRYILSSLAYQGTTVSHDYIQAANRYARKPDLTLFFYVPAAVALDRVKQRGAKLERYETPQHMQAIEREYNRL